MRSRGHAWLLCAALVGCADEDRSSDVELEPRCGGDGIVKLLELDPSEASGVVQRFDDERLRVTTYATEGGGSLRSLLVPDCGGEPESIAPNLAWVLLEQGVLLGCDRDGALVRLASLDDDAPVVLAERACGYRPTKHGLVTLDARPGAEVARLVRIRADGRGSVAVDTLLDDIPIASNAQYFPAVSDDEAFAVRSDDALWRVDLATGGSDAIVHGVADYWISPTHVLYRRIDAFPDGETAVMLHDRTTGAETVLAAAFPASVMIELGEDVAVLGRNRLPAPLWFSTADGHAIVPPAGTQVVWASEGGVFWLNRIDTARQIVDVLRWREGTEPERTFTCRDCATRGTAGRPGLQVVVELPGQPRELWFATDTGGQAKRIATPIGEDFRMLADDRVLTVLDETGDLLVYPPDGGAGHKLATSVRPWSVWSLESSDGGSNRDLFYEVDDDAGDHALYSARLADPR